MSNIFPISWLAESPKAFRMAYYSIVLGSQTAQAWVLVMLPAGTVTLDSYSLCPFIVDTEKMLPKSPWISLTNKRCLFSSLTHFFFLLLNTLQKVTMDFWSHFTQTNQKCQVYNARASAVNDWSAGIPKSSDLDSTQDTLCCGIRLQISCTKSRWGRKRTLKWLFPCPTLSYQFPQGRHSFFF